MSILLIIMILGWAFLAFAPSWVEHAVTAISPTDGENLSASRPGRVPAYPAMKNAENGPTEATIFRVLDAYAAAHQTSETQRLRTRPVTTGAEDARDGVRRLTRRTTIDRDFVVKFGSRFQGSIFVRGDVRIATGASVDGDIDAAGSVVVEHGSTVVGSIVSEKDVRLEAGASVDGSVTASGFVWVYENARVGFASDSSYIKANDVIVAPSARVHGSIWARHNGVSFPGTRAA